jgi:tetratricopeptide (TPR) repeat protein
MKNKLILLLVIAFAVHPLIGNACSMYKITKNGKTIVGNNEDWLSPNHQFWFERASKNKFGVMYMGQLDNFAQGAINEAGLVFDGFFEPDNLPVKNTAGKFELSMTEAIKTVMQTMTNVEQVKVYMETINLSSLTNSMIVFVDKSGTYLIVEGDEMFIGDESEKTFSNFYYSQIDSVEKVNLDYFQSGQKFINTSDGQPSLDYCAEAMDNFAQSKKIAVTQYATIYDLNTLTIRVYLFQDYSQFIEIDLKQELEKENHSTMIPDLFPKESLGYQHYLKYNNEAQPTLFIEELIGDENISEEEFNAMGFGSIINPIGYEWLVDKKNPEGAIKVFEYGITLMPNNSNLYDSLGEAHFTNNDWDNAIKNYTKSLALNPENENATAMILKIKERKKQK